MIQIYAGNHLAGYFPLSRYHGEVYTIKQLSELPADQRPNPEDVAVWRSGSADKITICCGFQSTVLFMFVCKVADLNLRCSNQPT